MRGDRAADEQGNTYGRPRVDPERNPSASTSTTSNLLTSTVSNKGLGSFLCRQRSRLSLGIDGRYRL